MQTGPPVPHPWWHILDVTDEEVWLVASEIKLNYRRELSKPALLSIEANGCRLDTEKERIHSRFDRVRQVQPEERAQPEHKT